jgi:hypothetical protein
VYVLLCRIYSYSGCRRLKQSSAATYKVSRVLQLGQHLGEANASEVHTFGVHTLLKDTTPKHQIAIAIQLPTMMCDVGPTWSYPHISTASTGLTHSGERRSTRKVYLGR